MNRFLFITIFIFINTISLESDFNYETIVELVPKTFFFDGLNTDSFKIFQYIPSCEQSVNLNKKILLKVTSSVDIIDLNRKYKLYLYEEFKDIRQNENEEFINYKESHTIFNDDLPFNLHCEKEYYFVFSGISKEDQNYYYSIGPFTYQIVILNKEEDTINISPTLSDHYSFSQALNMERKYYYSHNETKYVLICSRYDGKIKIIENDNIIYENKTEYISKVIEFKKDINYTIIYNLTKYSSLINFQFFNEPQFFKHDFNNGPLIVYQNNKNYYYEIDISNYKIGENIVFFISTYLSLEIGYQFKSVFKEKSLIGISSDSNFISIKKIRDDSSLIIYFYSIGFNFLTLNLIKAEEIKSDYESIINGPKFFLIDYNTLNGMNSIGIESTIPFYLYEQKPNILETEKNNKYYLNLYFTKQNYIEFHYPQKALIYFNQKSNGFFHVKKFNYSIFYVEAKELSDFMSSIDYFQMCQGEDSPKELYFYNTEIYYYSFYNYGFFSSVFGNYNTYFIKENDIKNISDLDFDKTEENNFDNFDKNNGYLKINCTNPIMLKHSKIFIEGDKYQELISGQRYYISKYNIKSSTKYTFHEELVNKNLNLRFTLFGLKQNENVKLIFNQQSYELSNIPLEINYEYKIYTNNLFYFECKEDIKNLFEVEIIVGFLPEDLENNYEIKDLVDCFGENNIPNNKKGVIIKVPKEFDDNFYDLSIIIPPFQWNNYKYENNDVQISYDYKEFIVPMNLTKIVSPIIPLFKDNPYKYISEEENKYFYIMIYSYRILYDTPKTYIIKKPKLYNDIQFNKINVLPNLLDKDNKKYYYKIKIPQGDYNSLLINTLIVDTRMTLSNNNIQYPLVIGYNNPVIYFDNNKKDIFLNFYETDPNFGYINLVKNYYNYNNKGVNGQYEKNLKVNQIEGENKIKIKMNSLSYFYYPDIFKYYIYINVFDYDYQSHEIYSRITNQKKLDESNFMTIIEDDGTKEIFEYEIDIDINLNEEQSNSITLIPVRKEINLIDKYNIQRTYFDYKNHNQNSSKKTILIIIFAIVGAILIIVVLIIVFKVRKKKGNSIDDLNEPITDDKIELSPK